MRRQEIRQPIETWRKVPVAGHKRTGPAEDSLQGVKNYPTRERLCNGQDKLVLGLNAILILVHE
jgi:hypothetical protein